MALRNGDGDLQVELAGPLGEHDARREGARGYNGELLEHIAAAAAGARRVYLTGHTILHGLSPVVVGGALRTRSVGGSR